MFFMFLHTLPSHLRKLVNRKFEWWCEKDHGQKGFNDAGLSASADLQVGELSEGVAQED